MPMLRDTGVIEAVFCGPGCREIYAEWLMRVLLEGETMKPLTREEALKIPALAQAIAASDAKRQLSGNSGELDGASEKQVMAEIVTALEAKGYRRPSHWEPGTRGIYMRCGQHRADFGGSDKGVPDLILIHCTTGRCTLVEVKARTKSARPSKEQNTLAQLGAIAIVNSAAQVLALLEKA